MNTKSKLNTNCNLPINLVVTAEPGVILHNNKIINELVLEDLEYIEKDLEFYEKVQLGFLLYSHKYSMLGLQKILISSKNISAPTNFLIQWANKEEKWKDILLEALSIAQINHIILKLGLNIEEIQERYVPTNPDLNIFIHPIIRALYCVCDGLEIEDARKLITHMQETRNFESEFIWPEYIEIHLLDWIQRSILTLGDWSFQRNGCNMTEYCDISEIISFLKINGLDNMKDTLHNASIRLSFTKNNRIHVDEPELKKTSQQIQVDKKLQLLNEKISRNIKLQTNKSEFYTITKENAGYILIINQEQFYIDNNSEKIDQGLQKRSGTEHDTNSLAETFSKYGFIPQIKNNLTDKQIIPCVKRVVTESRTKDALIVCILSHGKKGL